MDKGDRLARRPEQPKSPAFNQDQLTQFYLLSLPRHLIELAEWSTKYVHEGVRARGHTGLRRSHESVLIPLQLTGSRLVDIARASKTTKNSISQLADQLESMGYVERTADSEDGRAIRLRYTDSGFRLVSDGMLCYEDLATELIDLIGERKFTQLKNIAKELAQKINQ